MCGDTTRARTRTRYPGIADREELAAGAAAQMVAPRMGRQATRDGSSWARRMALARAPRRLDYDSSDRAAGIRVVGRRATRALSGYSHGMNVAAAVALSGWESRA